MKHKKLTIKRLLPLVLIIAILATVIVLTGIKMSDNTTIDSHREHHHNHHQARHADRAYESGRPAQRGRGEAC